MHPTEQPGVFPEGTKTQIGITNILTRKVIAIYPHSSWKAARLYRDQLDSRCGKSIYADWCYSEDELRSKGLFIPVDR